MSVSALLAELDAAGVSISRAGESLLVRGASGAGLAPYTERIREAKPALLALLREREAIADIATSLEAGWDWLRNNSAHPQHEAFLSHWLDRLSTYEQTYAAHHEQGEASCPTS